MADIRQAQDQIIRNFQRLEDPFDQYTYLLSLSASLPVMSDERRASLSPIAGCQSHVWLDVRREGDMFVFDADSDTMLIRGILYLLRQVLSHQPLAAAASAQLDFLEKSGITGALSADRRKGIGYVVQALNSHAAALLALRYQKFPIT